MHPKQQLDGTGVRPKRSFGQNFLVDETHKTAIARLVLSLSGREPSGGHRVVELGAGLGALTGVLLDLGGRMDEGLVVHAVERDRDLVPLLKKRFAREIEGGALLVHEDNALTVPLEDKLGARGALCGNLPYHLAAQLCLRALDLWPRLGGACFLVQKEVGDRIAAGPGTKDYGSLSVLLQSRFDVELSFVVPAGAFWPVPDVDGGVVALRPLPAPRGADVDLEALRAVVRPAFQQRRKTLRNALSKVLDDAALGEAGIEGSTRAEDVPVEAWTRLAAVVVARGARDA